MRPVFVYKADPQRGQVWAQVFRQEAPEVDFRLWSEVVDADDVRFLAAWEPPSDIAVRFPRLQLLFSTGAGVDQFDFGALPPQLPIVRMVEPGIVQGMVEYATHAVLDLHRDMPAYRRAQSQRRWQPLSVRLASERRIGVLGLGSLGQAVLDKLVGFGFDCAGWSRSPRALDGVRCFAGAGALPDFLARTDILVCLLPLTDATRGILNRELFARLPKGAALVNAGRGGHLVEADLIAALDSGHLSAAVLDVLEPEPPAPDHSFWTHPRILLTPHVASMTQPDTAVSVVLDNIRRHQSGEPLRGLVDRARGY
jgi:glyoxylate/hydroxypyruvate reductase A